MSLLVFFVYSVIYYFAFANKGGNPYQQTVQQKMQTLPPTQEVSQPSNPPSTNSAAMQSIIVLGNEFAFTPATITVKQGQQVKLTFKNGGKYPHNLDISDLAVKTKTIQPGEEDTVTFTADKKGTFTYLCTVPGHAEKGMKGTLTVE